MYRLIAWNFASERSDRKLGLLKPEIMRVHLLDGYPTGLDGSDG